MQSAHNTQSIVRLENVWKTYHMGETRLDALKGVSFEVRQGEFFSIVGPSGCGKSTAMHIIGALDKVTNGAVFVNSDDLGRLSEDRLAELRRKKFGFVFQRFNLIATLTALENVELPMVFEGISKEKRVSLAGMLLEEVGLGQRLKHKSNQLSGGEQQRVAIARALANDPEIILADEPTGNLDSKTGSHVIELLKQLNKKGKTVIIVTHEERLASQTNRTAYLLDGKVVKVKSNN